MLLMGRKIKRPNRPNQPFLPLFPFRFSICSGTVWELKGNRSEIPEADPNKSKPWVKEISKK
jgi:hypothetical protein